MNPKYMPRRLDCDSISARCTHHCDTQISTISYLVIRQIYIKVVIDGSICQKSYKYALLSTVRSFQKWYINYSYK